MPAFVKTYSNLILLGLIFVVSMFAFKTYQNKEVAIERAEKWETAAVQNAKNAIVSGAAAEVALEHSRKQAALKQDIEMARQDSFGDDESNWYILEVEIIPVLDPMVPCTNASIEKVRIAVDPRTWKEAKPGKTLVTGSSYDIIVVKRLTGE